MIKSAACLEAGKKPARRFPFFGVDEILNRRESIQQTYTQRKRLPLWLFLAGFPFILIVLIIFFAGLQIVPVFFPGASVLDRCVGCAYRQPAE